MTIAPTPLHTRRMPHDYLWALAALVIGLIVGGTVGLLVGSNVFEDSSSSTGVQGSGVAATEARDLPPFSSVELAGSNTVTIRVGGEQSSSFTPTTTSQPRHDRGAGRQPGDRRHPR